MLGNVAVRGLSTLREGLLLAGLGFVIATLTRNPWIVPERKRQVVGDWAAEGLAQASLRWGVELGMGVRTFIVTPAFYGLLVVAVAQPAPIATVTILVFYGVTRGLTIVFFSLRIASISGDSVLGAGMGEKLRHPAAAMLLVVVLLLLLPGST
ncbi:MAG: hypothetical protein JJE05_05650 [Actinobacteria bacterium]|nr:hypothetical protein [Actinomycetota bacterium]